jgi:hypothetical protein
LVTSLVTYFTSLPRTFAALAKDCSFFRLRKAASEATWSTVAGSKMKLKSRTRRLGYIHKLQPTGYYCGEVGGILAVPGKFSEVPCPPPPQRQKDDG